MNKQSLIALLACLVVAACGEQAAEPQAEAQPDVSEIEALADEFLAAVMDRYPSLGTQLGLEGARHDRLYDNSLEALADRGLVRGGKKPVKILGAGELTKKLTVQAHKFSSTAQANVEKAGGSCEVVSP